MRRPVRKVRPAYRSLTREQELAIVICAAVHHGGCACDQAAAGPCSKMVWAAGRAMKFLGAPNQSEGRQT